MKITLFCYLQEGSVIVIPPNHPENKIDVNKPLEIVKFLFD